MKIRAKWSDKGGGDEVRSPRKRRRENTFNVVLLLCKTTENELLQMSCAHAQSEWTHVVLKKACRVRREMDGL
jgi:hypothetical protein